MMPTIAIIGRPNVGKSTLFNRLIERRQALVDATPGVTRDRIYGTVEWAGTAFRAIDTGGLDLAGTSLARAIRSQTDRAIAEADLFLVLFDAREGLTPLDEEIVTLLRRANRPTLYVLNKVDTARQEAATAEFAPLGARELYCISAEHGRRIDEVLDAIVGAIDFSPSPLPSPQEGEGKALRIAIIGRPNVGKSTLVNYFAGQPRVVAHERPGTTRDAIDVAVTLGDRSYVFVDTAGIRRRARTDTRVEKFSIVKALQAMEQANAVILLIDAVEGLTHQDRQLAQEIVERYQPVVIGANKWDAVPKRKGKTHEAELQEALRAFGRIPLCPMSARTGFHCRQLLTAARHLVAAGARRLKTAELNQVLTEVQARHHLPSYRSQPVRIYYGTQVGTAPTTIVCFANYPATIPTAYQRYLRKALEEAFGAPGMPIRLRFRKR